MFFFGREGGREFLSCSFSLSNFSPSLPIQKKREREKTHIEPLGAARRRGRVQRSRRHQLPPGRDGRRRPGAAGRGVPAEGRRARRRVGAGLRVGDGADSLVDHAGEAGGGVGGRRGVGALGSAAGEFLREGGGQGGGCVFIFWKEKGIGKRVFFFSGG